jgi:hypothetical protein
LVNVRNPADDQDAATKKYVDDAKNSKVTRSGDTMSGNLMLSIGSDHLRELGCTDLNANSGFSLVLGSDRNKIKCRLSHPIAVETTNGLMIKFEGHDIIRFGKSSSDKRTHLYEDIYMNQHFIGDLKDPRSPQDAATKSYVDNAAVSAPKKNLVGYIPQLEHTSSRTGFVIASSGTHARFVASNAFNTSKDCWLNTATTGWLQVRCPDQVKVWRILLKARPIAGRNITAWNLSASNDGTNFTTLLTSTTVLEGSAAAPSFFNVTTNDAYQIYRLNITASVGSSDVGVQYMQLYVYDI